MNNKTRAGLFQTTSWSLVRRAGAADGAIAMQALTTLCEALWYPIYAYIRRSGRSPHDAEDLTQGFFARLLEKDTLAKADASKGRLRTFLLACACNFLADEHDRAMAQKRGQESSRHLIRSARKNAMPRSLWTFIRRTGSSSGAGHSRSSNVRLSY